MYTVAVTRDFIANHYLVGGDWGSENALHAHHYVLELSLQSEALDQHGYLVDITAIEAALDAEVGYFRDATLNDKAEFAGLNPSLEHFSRILCERLLSRLAPPQSGTMQVKLWENTQCWAAYSRAFP